MKKVVLISSGQPSLNPRLIKEADALADANYEVTVLYAYWNDWGTVHDEYLLASKKWTAIRLGGSPQQKRFIYFFSRLIYKVCNLFLQQTNNYRCFANLAIARSSYFLIKGAKKHGADLYIAHNLGALPAAAKTSKKHNKPYGFDAEDFHRQEITDDVNSYNFKICKYIEDKYLPAAKYITAASPLIAEKYTSLYNKKAITVLNVFPKIESDVVNKNFNEPLKLFWFSQTIGLKRGIEEVLDALQILNTNQFDLHLLGNTTQQIKDIFTAKLHGTASTIYFHSPIAPDEILEFAKQFDIGLASENRVPFNRNICLTNKIFTYVQSGLAVLASNTAAQSIFMSECGVGGRLYEPDQPQSFADDLMHYTNNRDELNEHKQYNFNLGQSTLNWEIEKKKFLNNVIQVA